MIEHFKDRGYEKFRTVIKHHKNGVFFLMDDALVSKVEKKFVQERQAYILLYALKPGKQERNIRHNISSQRKLLKENQVKLDSKELSLIPNYWYEKLMTLKNPGKIHSAQFYCEHKLIKPDFYDCFPFVEFKLTKDFNDFFQTVLKEENLKDNIDEPYEIQMNRKMCQTKIIIQKISFESVALPKAIVEYLNEIYGGTHLSNELHICQTCLLYAQNLRERRILERSLITKYENQENSGFAVIEIEWYKRWRRFLYSENRFTSRHNINGYPMPDPIDNTPLLITDQDEMMPLHNLKKDLNYAIVNGYVWMILKSLYKGG